MEVEDDDMEISMHAIEGRESANSLKIQGEVNGKTIVILVDGGSTHTFWTQR
ncbi:conserved hypothetical protein [Ricinus communis]|uniref:Uncharacterized protein n=1 Tax=Ricinus communis TaxID=3988 RepID=B9S7H2_RICCO|nr:conserved hypothetical protein [Ricinus communis]